MTLVRSTKGGPFRQSVIMPSKGLLNNPGENNCFMNSAVQVLWHLDVFRRSFRLLVGHACLEDCCIFCALKEIFGKFQESDEAALPPDVLRIAMAKAFQDQRKFEIGRMGDAAECFENILRRLHHHIAYGQNEDLCLAKHCIPHQKFAMQLCEQTICKCGATSEQSSFFQFVNYVVASNLVTEARKPIKNGYRRYQSFGEFLKATSSFAESAPCPNEEKCTYREKSIIPTSIHRTLLNCPDIVAIGITWDTDRPAAEYVMDVLDCLGKRLQIKDLFDTVVDSKARSMKLRLVGIMTYYGKHYTTFVYNSKQETWFYLDDAEVKEIGKNWNIVRDRCIRGRHQPLLVFYANQEGEPIKVTKAPQGKKIVSKEELLNSQVKNKSPHKKGGVRVEPQKQKRAKKEKETDEKEAVGAGKRKSLKNMVGSVLNRKKSVKTKPEKPGRMRYSGDHVLSVNGQEQQKNDEFLSQSLDEEYLKENRFVEDDLPKQKRKSDVRDQISPLHKSLEIDFNESKMKPKSPLKSSEIDGKMNGAAPQTHRLRKHQQHVKSIESKLDTAGDASDYDNVEGTKIKTSQQKKRKSHETVERERKRGEKMSPVGDRRQSNRSSDDAGIQELDHQPRRFIDQGDAYADIFGEADSLIVSSIAAEQEGNLVESYHLCNEANIRYKRAFGLQGITDKMRNLADTKFMETQYRSRLLSSNINAFQERAPKSADYKRDMSKTSDYGSLSDASGSPITPAEYPSFNRNDCKENQDKNKLAEIGGIQAKLNKDRRKLETSKQPDDIATKPFFTLPRMKKHHHRKLSSPQPPTESEKEQLNDLLEHFENGSQSRRKGGKIDSGKSNTANSKSIQGSQSNYKTYQDRGQDVNLTNRIGAESFYNSTRNNTHDFVMANSDAISSKIDQRQSEGTDMYDQSRASRANDVSRPGVSNSTRMPSLPSDVDGQGSYMLRKSDGVFVNHATTVKSFQDTTDNADNVKPEENFRSKNINERIDSNFREEFAIDEANCTRPESSNQEGSEPSASINKNVNSQGASSILHVADVSKSPELHAGPLQNDYKNRSLDAELNSPPIPNLGSSPKYSRKKRSIFQVVIPKIFSMDNSRKPKKPMATREEQYAAMLNAETGAVPGIHGAEAPGNHCKTADRDDFPNGLPVPDSSTNKVLCDVDSKHEESYVVDPEVAQEEVAMIAKHITEQRLFKDSDFQGASPKSSSQFIQFDARYNDRSSGYEERNKDGSKSVKNNAAPLYELSNVDEGKSREAETLEERYKKVVSPQKIVVSSVSVSERLSVDRNENEIEHGKLNNFISPNAMLTSSMDDLQNNKDSPRCREEKTNSMSKSSSNLSDNLPQPKKVEPPPRKNPDVYRSSELYKPKTDAWKHSMTRSCPEEGGNPTGRSQPISPKYHGNTLSRWTNQVDFSKSTRQMCQQCGTVTVEKPRKFCRKCQSDYV